METLINLYIDSKKYAWAETTICSERARLRSISNFLNGDPEYLWQNIQSLNPYSRSVLWIRVTQFYDWKIEQGVHNGSNSYKTWRKKNSKAFKNCYIKTKPELTFDEALSRIRSIRRTDIRSRAFELIGSGLRYFECAQQTTGRVTGKGNKTRNSYKPQVRGPTYECSYETFRRHLAKIGLRPHDLRKLALTKIVELGANEFELCEIAGWSSINTASSYIKTNQSKVTGLMEQLQVDIKGR